MPLLSKLRSILAFKACLYRGVNFAIKLVNTNSSASKCNCNDAFSSPADFKCPFHILRQHVWLCSDQKFLINIVLKMVQFEIESGQILRDFLNCDSAIAKHKKIVSVNVQN